VILQQGNDTSHSARWSQVLLQSVQWQLLVINTIVCATEVTFGMWQISNEEVEMVVHEMLRKQDPIFYRHRIIKFKSK
jgi:hypothetical protein